MIRFKWSASSWMVCKKLQAVLCDRASTSFCSSVVAAPVIADSGVRRSWEMELRRVLRRLSVSAFNRALLRGLGEKGAF